MVSPQAKALMAKNAQKWVFLAIFKGLKMGHFWAIYWFCGNFLAKNEPFSMVHFWPKTSKGKRLRIPCATGNSIFGRSKTGCRKAIRPLPKMDQNRAQTQTPSPGLARHPEKINQRLSSYSDVVCRSCVCGSCTCAVRARRLVSGQISDFGSLTSLEIGHFSKMGKMEKSGFRDGRKIPVSWEWVYFSPILAKMEKSKISTFSFSPKSAKSTPIPTKPEFFAVGRGGILSFFPFWKNGSFWSFGWNGLTFGGQKYDLEALAGSKGTKMAHFESFLAKMGILPGPWAGSKMVIFGKNGHFSGKFFFKNLPFWLFSKMVVLKLVAVRVSVLAEPKFGLFGSILGQNLGQILTRAWATGSTGWAFGWHGVQS